jgi:hypothetical protein
VQNFIQLSKLLGPATRYFSGFRRFFNVATGKWAITDMPKQGQETGILSLP